MLPAGARSGRAPAELVWPPSRLPAPFAFIGPAEVWGPVNSPIYFRNPHCRFRCSFRAILSGREISLYLLPAIKYIFSV